MLGKRANAKIALNIDHWNKEFTEKPTIFCANGFQRSKEQPTEIIG